ncbi:hypothetical protein [Haloarchaeobius salinus]|uniref:hypothetical protein n=1 Tax=Haloarchaeobius salinus TaxID=1198298 RepID=UPI00210EC6F8|nr:hypothetical protein [Haloarchaeobius salinus]
MNRRRFLASTTSTLTVASLAGCLDSLGGSDDSGDGPTTTDPTHAPTDDDIAETTTDPTHAPTDDDIAETTTGGTDGPLSGVDEFDPDHPIRVDNGDDTTHTLSLRIRRDGEEVHSMSVEIEPGFEGVVYNLERLEPDGIVQYRIVAEVGSNRDSRAVQTTACFGDVNVAISEGEPTVGFEIC